MIAVIISLLELSESKARDTFSFAPAIHCGNRLMSVLSIKMAPSSSPWLFPPREHAADPKILYLGKTTSRTVEFEACL
jgi:hypothetical protein